MAIDRQGNLIVLNNATARIMTFDGGGKLVSQWGQPGTKDGEINSPIAVALDSMGSIYIADFMVNTNSNVENAVVAKFDGYGKYLKTFAAKAPVLQGYVSGIAVDAQDNVYTAAAWSNRIDKFDSTGKYITTLGSSGSGDDQIKKPGGLAVDSSGMLYVADTENYRISKLDSNGKFISKITSCGSDTSVKFIPVDIALDATGNIYVTDDGSVGVCKYDSNGKFMSRWGAVGTGDGQFARGDPLNDWPSPGNIVVDKQGNIYVADYGNHRIVKFGAR